MSKYTDKVDEACLRGDFTWLLEEVRKNTHRTEILQNAAIAMRSNMPPEDQWPPALRDVLYAYDRMVWEAVQDMKEEQAE